MRILGSIMVMTGTTLFGFWLADCRKRKINNLQQVIFFLERLMTEVCYSLRPLPEALGTAIANLNGPLHEIVESIIAKILAGDGISAPEALKEAFVTGKDDLMFNHEEMDIILQWGAALGGSDREDQVRLLKLTIERLKAREVQLQTELKKNGKLIRYFGFITGAALVLIFY